jgi:hypothetical protein
VREGETDEPYRAFKRSKKPLIVLFLIAVVGIASASIFIWWSTQPTPEGIVLEWSVMDDASNLLSEWGTTVRAECEGKEILQMHQAVLRSSFSYTEPPPDYFLHHFRYEATNVRDTEYDFRLTLDTPEGTTYKFWGLPILTTNSSKAITLDSREPLFLTHLGVEPPLNAAKTIFSTSGEYTFTLTLRFVPTSSDATSTIEFQNSRIVFRSKLEP